MTFEIDDRVQVIGQDMWGTVERVGKKLSILLRDGRYEGETLQLSPQCLLHVFDEEEKIFLLSGEKGVNA